MAHVVKWGRLIKYRGHTAYRPYREWVIHCFVFDLLQIANGSLSTSEQPEMLDAIIKQADVNDLEHKDYRLKVWKRKAMTMASNP